MIELCRLRLKVAPLLHTTVYIFFNTWAKLVYFSILFFPTMDKLLAKSRKYCCAAAEIISESYFKTFLQTLVSIEKFLEFFTLQRICRWHYFTKKHISNSKQIEPLYISFKVANGTWHVKKVLQGIRAVQEKFVGIDPICYNIMFSLNIQQLLIWT